ncbi:GlxA family transcriptional regulator [Paracoccus seriniphilus]|uniref:Transcriptional regulator, AraC family n=1 Tax=Paracoccus seriniphilus TaxID=184748 RepID=A0A239Q2X0_9RHOB|nr:helix-turn-helix domain-containing protein [Paracoccus seriniphilus]WCR16097.1 helix-turn-helix domain-containing protein [Paracoccus seriniphilus]SNT76287.1 transcriptional regulator, AraC family [Paracoccus seriniphilus]
MSRPLPSEDHSTPADDNKARGVSVMILVEPGFVPTELGLAQDVLRIANRLSKAAIFDVRLCSSCDQELVEGLGGMMARVETLPDANQPRPDHVVVLGGNGVGRNFKKLQTWIRGVERRGSEVILLSDASSEWKKLDPDNRDVTTHWENHQILRDVTMAPHLSLPLYSRSNRIISAAGMMATADVVLNTIVAPRSIGLAHSVSQVLVMHAIRAPDMDQPRSENDITPFRHARLERVIELMENNLETPLSIRQLAELSGFSIRQLERRFHKAAGCSPKTFYRSMRLKRGRALVEQSSMSITDIAISLGFSNSTVFSRLYAREYGITPARARALR